MIPFAGKHISSVLGIALFRETNYVEESIIHIFDASGPNLVLRIIWRRLLLSKSDLCHPLRVRDVRVSLRADGQAENEESN